MARHGTRDACTELRPGRCMEKGMWATVCIVGKWAGTYQPEGTTAWARAKEMHEKGDKLEHYLGGKVCRTR